LKDIWRLTIANRKPIDVQKKIEVQSSTLGCCGPKNKLKRNGIKLRDRVGFEAAYDL
jgi:hypothetical protein